MSLNIPAKTWSGSNNKPSTGGYYGMDALTHQIELIANGIGRNTSTGNYTWLKSPKYIPADKIVRATYQLEAVYRNQSPEDWTVTLVKTSGGDEIASLALPTTGSGNDANHWHRVRGMEVFNIADVGSYSIKESGMSVEGVLFTVRLVPTQTRFRETVINIPLLIAGDGTYSDLGGIAGGDIFRNAGTTYLPTIAQEAGGNVTNNHNFIVWKYIASEWSTIEHVYFEVTSDGFSNDYHIALFDRDSDTIVPSSDIHITDGSVVTNSFQEISLSELTDGHSYSARLKSQGSANAFLYNVNLQIHLSSVRYGNAYYRVSNYNPGQAKSKLPSNLNKFFYSVTGYPRSGTHNIYATNNGTTDSGLGSDVAASVINLTNSTVIKAVQRSADITGNLVVGNRYDSENDGGNLIEANLIGQFVGSLHPCL